MVALSTKKTSPFKVLCCKLLSRPKTKPPASVAAAPVGVVGVPRPALAVQQPVQGGAADRTQVGGALSCCSGRAVMRS